MSQQVEAACLAADRGSFDAAVALALQVGPDRVEYAACRSLVASVYRQVGRHDRALPFDRSGLADDIADPLGAAMCRLGLAADSVGGLDLAGSRAALAQGRSALQAVPADHWATRWFDPWLTAAWVGAEVSLLAGEPAAAVEVLAPYAARRRRAVVHTRWPQEQAKTLLFLGVAQRCAGSDAAALESLEAALRLSARAGLRPLIGPACEQLRELDPTRAGPWLPHAERAAEHLLEHLPPLG